MATAPKGELIPTFDVEELDPPKPYYRIVRGENPRDLAQAINALHEQGYVAIGGVCAISVNPMDQLKNNEDSNKRFAQAMVKETD